MFDAKYGCVDCWNAVIKRVNISSVIGIIEMSLDSKCMFYSEDSCVDCWNAVLKRVTIVWGVN